MNRFIRVMTQDIVTYYSVDRIVSVEIDHQANQAKMIHDGTAAAVMIEGKSYDELIAFLGHDLSAAVASPAT